MLKIAWTPEFVFDVPKGHKFPMDKYDLLPGQLIHEGTINEQNLFAPKEIEIKYLQKIHHSDYLNRLFRLELTPREQRVTGFLHNEALIKRERMIMEGTRMAVDYAKVFGVAMNIAGGTHHAYTNKGEGFCLLNDLAIAAQYALDADLAQKILIIDLDVHQGNGTAEIFRNSEKVFTFSMHGKDNYPLKKEHSDFDFELPTSCGDDMYQNALKHSLDTILSNNSFDFIFYQSGVDVLATDKLGKLGLSMNGLKERDRTVIELAHSLNVPLVVSMGGGYSPDVNIVVEAHATLYRQIQYLYF
jgi:acetoin utilization deacetylase AcuC-like enzyme